MTPLTMSVQVSTLRTSQSDERRFYIYSGTKTLHLRAESSADRAAWLDVLQVAKDLFPRCSLLLGLVPPKEEIKISTDKLRAKLTEFGLKEDQVKECEEIMLAEFTEVKEQLEDMDHRRMSLIEKLRLLEVLAVIVADVDYCIWCKWGSGEIKPVSEREACTFIIDTWEKDIVLRYRTWS